MTSYSRHALVVPLCSCLALGAEPSHEQQVSAAFAQAVKDHQALVVPPTGSPVGPDLVRFSSSSQRLDEWAVRRSEAMDRLLKRVQELEDSSAELRGYFQAAKGFLGHEKAEDRAVACEFLARAPAKLGLTDPTEILAVLGALLADKAVAYPGVELLTPGSQLARPTTTGKPIQIIVADFGSAALNSLTGFWFLDRETFKVWWNENQDHRGRLWYWAKRWSGRRTQDPISQGDEALLEKLDPKTALKVLLLVDNTSSRHAEGALPWILSGDKRELVAILPMVHFMVPAPEPRTIAEFIKKRSLEDFVVQLLAGDCPWREVTQVNTDEERKFGGYARAQLLDTLIPVAELALRKEHAAPLEAASKRRLGPPDFPERTPARLALLATALDPDRAEEILLAQIERDPGDPDLLSAMVVVTGPKHWKKVEAAYAKLQPQDGKSRFVRALGKSGATARSFLKQLSLKEDLSARLTDGEPSDDAFEVQALFLAFTEAARSLHGGSPVIAEEILKRASFRGGKGGTAQWREHNLKVPAAREEALKMLKGAFE